MLILLYGNTLVCWLVTFLPSVIVVTLIWKSLSGNTLNDTFMVKLMYVDSFVW